jgi:protein-S-isoprenylcysteine O-methyltransferase Ste14
MLTGWFQSAAVLCAALAFYVIDRAYTRRHDRQREQGGTATTWLYMIKSAALACALIAQPVLLPGLGLRIAGAAGLALQALGLLLVLAAAALDAWSRHCLGVHYAQRAELQPEHRLVREGPYAHVRHPIYSAYLLVALGLLLVLPSALMLLVTAYAYRIFRRAALRDERFLCAELPGYAAYMEQTPRFVPWVHPGLKPGAAN